MEIDVEQDKQIFDDISFGKDKEALEKQTKIDKSSIIQTSPKTSMKPISTNLPWDSFLFKPVSELETVSDIVPSLTEYFFNSQSKLVVRKTSVAIISITS